MMVENSMAAMVQALGLEGGGVVSIVGAGGKTSLMFRLAHEFRDRREPVLTTTTTKIMLPKKEQCRHVVLTPSVQSLVDQAEALLKKSFHLCAASPTKPGQKGKITGFNPDCIEKLRHCGLFRWILVEADGAAQKPLKVPAPHEPVIPDCSSWVIGVIGLTAIGKPLGPQWVFRHERYSAITGLAQGAPVTEDSVVRAALHSKGLFKGSPQRAEKILFFNAAEQAQHQLTGRRLAEKMRVLQANHDIRRAIVGSPLNVWAESDRWDFCH